MGRERELHVRFDGVLKMVAAWIRYREVFRADWWGNDKDPNMRVFRPFAASCELNAPRLPGATQGLPAGARVLPMEDWLRELARGGQDDLDLRLHEADWHGVRGKDDGPGITGLGSNDMLLRARTTTHEERAQARKRLLEAYDVVVLHGLP